MAYLGNLHGAVGQMKSQGAETRAAVSAGIFLAQGILVALLEADRAEGQRGSGWPPLRRHFDPTASPPYSSVLL